MQIVNHFRAKILHSSNAAFSLAMKNNKYLSFAEKIISAKNENAHCNLIKTHSDQKKEILINSKVFKYQNFLECFSKINTQPQKNSGLLGFSNFLPRLNVVKTNRNDHEYFLPYNNQPKGMIITAAKETSI